MADLKEESKWEAGIRQFETSDPVQGGVDGVDNIAPRQLANRTRYLKDKAEASDARADANDRRVDSLSKQVDTLGTSKLSVAGGAMKGALLGTPGEISGNNPKNVGIAFDGDPDTGLFSPADGYLQIGANGVPYVAMRGENLTLGAGGWLSLIAGGVERGRLTPQGRFLFGTNVDNGRDGMQVAYRATFANGVRSSGTDLDGTVGGQFRAVGTDYGVMLRNDDRDAYLMQTKKGDPLGPWNNYRPIAWNLETGLLRLDGSGCGTVIGGPVEVTGDLKVRPAWGEGRVFLGQNDGYFFANSGRAGWYSDTFGSFQYQFDERALKVNDKVIWNEGNLTPLDVNLGGTMKSTVYFATGARVVLSEGTAQNPSLTFDKDGAPDTGLYHVADGAFGVTCNGIVTARFTADKGTIFERPVQVPTPAAGDRSNNVATTAFVIDAIGSASIGQIIFEVRPSARAGYLKLNGALLNRADYPQLWAYAQASAALATEADWAAGWWGCFSTGDGATTFRIPEFRGEGIRCADTGRGVDPGRGIGSWQDSQNRSHAHGASASSVGDHTHSAWTDSQGWHAHGVNDPGHDHGIVVAGGGGYIGEINLNGGSRSDKRSGGSGTGISINGDGAHGHNVGVGGAGNHTHTISVAADGGSEARMRNVAVLAMIRAF